MALEFGKTTFLKIYTGEDVMLNDVPLYKAIISEAIRLGLSGGTVLRGIGGYATGKRGMGRAVNTFVSGNANNPVIVEIVDDRKNIEKILPFLEKNAAKALVLIEECNYMVTDYMRKRWAAKEKGEDRVPSYKLRKQWWEKMGAMEEQQKQQ